jgi:hypothetical protein
LVFLEDLFLSRFPTNILNALLFSFVIYAFLLSSSFTWLFCLAKSTSYEAPHYAVFFSTCRFFFLRIRYSPQHPLLKRPQSIFLP